MKHKDVWNFEYKGISCEIVHWGVGTSLNYGKGIWNAYIFIKKEQLPKDFEKLLVRSRVNKMFIKRKFWNYDGLEYYFDFHGGITYYSKERDEFTGKVMGIKVGCDYAHYMDEQDHHDEIVIQNDLEKSVDLFIKNFPDYLVWRSTDGAYVSPETLK